MKNSRRIKKGREMDIKTFIKEKQWKKWKKDQWLIVFLVGVLLLVIALPTGSEKEAGQDDSKTMLQQDENTGETVNTSYEDQIEDRLEEILKNVDGVGQVQVMITLKDGGEMVVEKDTESSSQSVTGEEDGSETNQQESSETTVYENQTEEESPFVSKETKPEIEGVLVVAQGGGNATTAQNISEAVQALFDIEIHKIKIVKMNIQEGTN